jgi:hypothetical protein
MADDKPLKGMSLEAVDKNIVFIRQDNSNGWVAEGFSLVYFMDSEESAKQMASGQIPYLMIPRGTFHSGGNPITDVWKKKFQSKGHEHIYVEMMSVRPKYKRNKINTLMINCLRRSYPQAKLQFSDATDDGKKFIGSIKESNIHFNWDDLRNKYTFDVDNNLHRIDLFNQNGAVGYIEWDRDSGEVEKIHVGRDLRRKGIGTHLWELATEWSQENEETPPEHSSRRSQEGDHFAKAIGGYIPSLTDDIDGWSSR